MIGGWGETPPEQALASVLALAADCSEWSTIAPTGLARCNAVTTVLPEGKVLVADSTLKTAELYDPATNAWTALPDMAHERSQFVMCVLPSGRVAGMGGYGSAEDPRRR